MTAECWAHVNNVAVVVPNGPGIPDPLGACFECAVFGCAGHAERDQGSGKWTCFASVANAVAVSAGVGQASAVLRVSSSGEFEARFPALAQATVEPRADARHRLARHPITSVVPDMDLLADAVGIAHALVPPDHKPTDQIQDLAEEGRLGRNEARSPRAATLRYLFGGTFRELLTDLES